MAAKIKSLVDKLLIQARPKLEVFKKYAKVELIPPKPNEIPDIVGDAKNILKEVTSGNWKCATVGEATVNTLVTLEVIFWFYVGECIGKRHFVGYKV